MQCPKCGHENPSGVTECTFCGVVFEKYKKYQEQNQPYNSDKQCPFCMEMVHKKAIKCKHCGEFFATDTAIDKEIQVNVSLGYFFSGLLDIDFQKLIAPTLIKATYAVFLFLGGLVTLIAFAFQLFNKEFLAAFITLLVFMIILIFMRMYSEFTMILFKIEKNTR